MGRWRHFRFRIRLRSRFLCSVLEVPPDSRAAGKFGEALVKAFGRAGPDSVFRENDEVRSCEFSITKINKGENNWWEPRPRRSGKRFQGNAPSNLSLQVVRSSTAVVDGVDDTFFMAKQA